MNTQTLLNVLTWTIVKLQKNIKILAQISKILFLKDKTFSQELNYKEDNSSY